MNDGGGFHFPLFNLNDMNAPLVIGLFGFGVVGEGIYQVLLQTPSLNAQIKRICIKDGSKKRNAPAELFTADAGLLLNDPEINVIVELINHPEEAFTICATALRKCKAVVSANKAMIAANLSQLLQMQRHYDTPLLYEAAACGSIPIIRNLEEYYDNDLLSEICGVVNGSTNFILTRISQDGLSYSEALLEARVNGFAESDPRLDVEGVDAAHKLTILLCHAYGVITKTESIFHQGITALHPLDSQFAKGRHCQIRLIAQARKLSSGKIVSFVLPQFIPSESQLYFVNEEYNGVVLQSSFADKQFLYGKGAGRFPTASAVLSDISALRYGYRYEYRKQQKTGPNLLTDQFYLQLYVSGEHLDMPLLRDFAYLTEFHRDEGREFACGVIAFQRLRSARWARDARFSLIVLPDGIQENKDEIFPDSHAIFQFIAHSRDESMA